jgi:DHA2 family multidrug resistance protein
MITTRKTRFLDPTLFKDRNFVAGCAFIFNVGLLLYATLALLPPLLQDLMNYPVVTTGLVTAPRGAGTLIAMLIIARFSKIIDVRVMIGFGFALSAFSALQMSRFDLQMDMYTVMWSGVAQGCGTGMVFVPLAGVAFATLKSSLRNEGAAMFSLSRNLGSSIGISVVETLLTRNTQTAHASLAGHITPFSPLMHAQFPGGVPTLQRLSALNAQVTEQAAMIAYNDNFKLMFWLSLAAIPLLLLLRKGDAPRAEEAVVVE